jgi:ATP-dependent DNA helicase PIF1
MLNDVYPRIAALDELEYWAARAIVAARHSTVDALNRLMLDRLTEEEVICYSTDMQDNDNHATVLPEEYLNREKPVGMPAHDLRLKKGAVVILLRNLRRSEGLVNGTRLIIEEFIRRGRVVRMLVCRILTGERRGARVIIPRILLRPPAGKYPASWARRQFPVKLAFAMYVKPLYSRACIYASAD